MIQMIFLNDVFIRKYILNYVESIIFVYYYDKYIFSVTCVCSLIHHRTTIMIIVYVYRVGHTQLLVLSMY